MDLRDSASTRFSTDRREFLGQSGEFLGSQNLRDLSTLQLTRLALVVHEEHVDAVGFCRFDAERASRPLLSRDVRRVA